MTQEQGNPNARKRRNFLRSAVAIGGGLTAASFVGAFGVGGADTAESDIATIVNLATTAETLALTFYYTAITGATFYIGEESVGYLKLAMGAEMRHLQSLQSLGGRSLTQQFYMPANMLADASVFVGTGLKAETTFTGAYLAATHQLAALGQPRLAATAAQHGASEAQHLTLLTHLAGLPPSDLAQPAPSFAHVSDAVPSLAPFLKGGAGFSTPVRCPSPNQYQAALGPAFARALA